MTITDYIGIVSTLALITYTVSAFVKIYQNSRKKPVPVPPAPVPAVEMPLRFSDFEASSIKLCCRVVAAGLKNDLTHLIYTYKKPMEGLTQVEVQVFFCPGCGRRLKERQETDKGTR